MAAKDKQRIKGIKNEVYKRRGTEALYMEEILLYGMVIGNMKTELENLFPYIERYVSLITNWSLCDSFCCSLKQTKKQSTII